MPFIKKKTKAEEIKEESTPVEGGITSEDTLEGVSNDTTSETAGEVTAETSENEGEVTDEKTETSENTGETTDEKTETSENTGETTDKKKQKKSKEKKTKEKKEKPKTDKVKKPLTKKQKITYASIGAGVLVVIILIVVLTRHKENYFDDVDAILSNDLGSFKYVIDVRTSPYKEGEEIKATNYSETDLKSLESQSEFTEEEIKGQGKHHMSIVDSWGSVDNVKIDEWEYPNYKLTISGRTINLSPYTCYYKIELATEYFNDMFTEIYCIDDTYYINIEQIKYWLKESQDGYLLNLGKEFDSGSKWLLVQVDKFKFSSHFAEKGEKSEITSLYVFKERITNLAQLAINYLGSSVSSDTLSSNGNMRYFVSENADSIAPIFRGMINNIGSMYDSYLEMSKETYTEDQYEQAVRQKDNFVRAFGELYYTLNTQSNLTLDIQGMTRTYTNSNNNPVIEANLNTAFSTEKKTYRVNIAMMRSGDMEEIAKPVGSCATLDTYTDLDILKNIAYGVVDYLNFTSVKLNNKLNIDIDTIRENIDADFIKLINDTDLVYATKNNFKRILENYEKYDKDGKLAEIVNQYNNINTDSDTEQKPTVTTVIEGKFNDTTYKIAKNEAETNSRLYVANLSITGEAVNTTDFSIKIGTNIYPCNNLVILRGYDSNMNFDIEETTNDNAKLYFVIPISENELTVYYKDTELGTISR